MPSPATRAKDLESSNLTISIRRRPDGSPTRVIAVIETTSESPLHQVTREGLLRDVPGGPTDEQLEAIVRYLISKHGL